MQGSMELLKTQSAMVDGWLTLTSLQLSKLESDSSSENLL